MKKTIMTQEIIDKFNKSQEKRLPKHRVAFTCKLCPDLFNASQNGLVEYWQPSFQPVFKADQEVYAVTYPNGTTGYYHIQCMDRLRKLHVQYGEKQPFYFMTLENILRLDVDKWQEINTFIETLIEKKLSDKHIIEAISSKFECSHTTAWRRLRYYQKRLVNVQV